MSEKLSSLRIPDMPADDQGAEMWLVNFAERLAYDPGRFGVSAELCGRVWDAVAAYSKAYEAREQRWRSKSRRFAAMREADEAA